MGKVIIKARVMPENLEVNVDSLKEKIKQAISKHGEFGRAVDVPIAFGLRAIEISFVLEDKGGVMTEVEDSIKELEGVGSFEIIDMTRAL